MFPLGLGGKILFHKAVFRMETFTPVQVYFFMGREQHFWFSGLIAEVSKWTTMILPCENSLQSYKSFFSSKGDMLIHKRDCNASDLFCAEI